MAKSARHTKVKKAMRPASRTAATDTSKVSKAAKMIASANRRTEVPTASDNRVQQSRTGPKVRQVVRRVSASVIQNEWVQLSETAREEIMKVMQAVSLAVHNSVTGEEKKKQVQEVVGSVLSKMERRLRRLPVPPSTKDRNFQYERMLELNVALEADLVTDLQQVTELEAEITAEQNELEKDTEYMQTLKHNAKSHEMLRGSQKKKLDKLLKDVSNVTPTNDDAESINLMDTSTADPQITADNDLKMLILRLGSHLTSIRNNIVGLEAVLAATRQVELVLNHQATQRAAGVRVCDD
ncbi:CENP-Q, a CENPA-CAD centromere complex subunit-domain-containing protein [Lipomyces orientalis]|uniref:CENP-Q, a CENPA-CAD centromere complex subunit-domain-containing protein n=1 Tax=Lipomyces orientalis TaxID=1233043 RepID=A0ACC3TNA0_9ASCO